LAELNWFDSDTELSSNVGQLIIEILDRIYISSIYSLFKKSGRVEALDALKPYVKATMMGTEKETRKRFNVKGNGPEIILTFFQLAQSTVMPTDGLVGEIRENAAVEVVSKCPFGNESTDLCLYFSHLHSEALCEVINPEYTAVFTHHLTNGDPYCRMVVKKKSDPARILDEPGKVLYTLPKIELPKEMEYGHHLAGASWGLNNVISAFIDLHGPEEARRVLGASANNIGQDIGNSIVNANGARLLSDEKARELINSLGKALNQQGDYNFISIDRMERTITSCSEQAWSPVFCYQYESLIQGMLEAINPNLEFAYDKMITKGDSVCHWTIKKKDEVIKEAPQEDPARSLALRFGRGEISLGEFEQSMDSLKKHGLVK
jgi:hypothetical protein